MPWKPPATDPDEIARPISCAIGRVFEASSGCAAAGRPDRCRLNAWGRRMATRHARSTARLMMAPAVILLLGWMLVPLTMTIYFSFKRYLPLRGGDLGWTGFDNYVRFASSSSFWPSVQATLLIVGGVLVITVVFGVLLALLLDQPMWGQGFVRLLVISPFFIMPTVSALVWKDMFMDPVDGMFAHRW